MSAIEHECRCTIAQAYVAWEMAQLPPYMMISVKGWGYRMEALMEHVEAILRP